MSPNTHREWIQAHTHIPPPSLRRANIIYETLELSLTYQSFLRLGEKREILSDFDENQGGHLT